MDPEEPARARMRELAAEGDFAGALSEFVRLEAELEVQPSRETRRLAEQIRRQAPPPLGSGGYRL